MTGLLEDLKIDTLPIHKGYHMKVKDLLEEVLTDEELYFVECVVNYQHAGTDMLSRYLNLEVKFDIEFHQRPNDDIIRSGFIGYNAVIYFPKSDSKVTSDKQRHFIHRKVVNFVEEKYLAFS